MTTTSILSPSSLSLLASWRRTDRKFFRKYSRDGDTMAVISALAELIATYDQQSTSHHQALWV